MFNISRVLLRSLKVVQHFWWIDERVKFDVCKAMRYSVIEPFIKKFIWDQYFIIIDQRSLLMVMNPAESSK